MPGNTAGSDVKTLPLYRSCNGRLPLSSNQISVEAQRSLQLQNRGCGRGQMQCIPEGLWCGAGECSSGGMTVGRGKQRDLREKFPHC